MSAGSSSDVKFEIGHVLFIDIVGYSKLLINEQSEQIQTLKEIVRGTEQFRLAEVEGKLVRLSTGDGGALVFRNSPEAPVLCALEICKALKSRPELETAYANRDAGLVRIFVIPFLMDYRDDPRFAAFCRKLGIENLPLKP